MNGLEFVCALPWQPDRMAYVDGLGLVCIREGERPLLVRIMDGGAVVAGLEISQETVH